MGTYPRIVKSDTAVVWDSNVTLVRRGAIVDIPPDSEMEKAYGGPENLEPLDQERVYS